MKGKGKIICKTLVRFLVAATLMIPVIVHGQITALTTQAVELLARGISNSPAALVNYIANAIAVILASLARVIFNFAGMFVNVALDLNFQVGRDTLARTGWTIARDIANMGFVLVIIIIAIMTILKIEQYGVKKLLPKLIAAAIIVNFSFMIAGVVIDFSNVITNFFYSRVASNNFGIAQNLAGAFNPQALGAPPTADNFNLIQSQSTLEALGNNLLRLIFIIIFTLAGALTLLTLAFMLLIRYLHLVFLLIISPIVWLFWVFPGLGGEFSRWWKSFFRWSFFAPASAFFLYLALVSVSNLQTMVGTATTNSGYGSNFLSDLLTQGAQMFVLVGIMLGGIIIAQEMGITGASGALALAGKARGTALGLVGQGGAWSGRKVANLGRKALSTGVDEKGKTALERFGARYGKIPLIGRAVTGVSGLSSKSKASLKEQSEELKKTYDKRTGEDAAAIASRRVTMPPEERAAAALRAAETGNWDNISQAGQELALKAIRLTSQGDKLLASHPEFAKQFGKEIEETMAKKVPDATKISDKTFADPKNIELSVYLKPAHISQLGNTGTDAQNGAKNLAGLNYIYKEIQRAKTAGDAHALQVAQNTLKTLRSSVSAQEKRAMDTYHAIQENVGFQDMF
ncbi:MAG: hypothetical protein UY23_C0001G0186 [Candidatus Jorgensenbacteria bacterium GW2011_GWA1_48_11]|uniref:TrbL/VirB6 plasmid conjugal transfer protein n=1 Tax=Candidatus Jorgensenbacteria bacterium GW2011_GWA1_48_11 TaxID=1618660 RepID=A0A0G1XB95_9BACT|nr:MAG: hypothetical protein UY23_C0001G0186 [Candidatus Jorgensenbacteria bacterium GW2011_GWA1_48_11]